ncbi:MAG TPA: YceI family protein [Bryobacteraceae bacterium]|nr:YceI family protein [Bryobacteraceae bacterium]
MKSIILILFSFTASLFGQETVLELDPAQTQVQFTLSDILHTVHGAFKLKRGTISYDFATGKCSGEIVIDARSGNSGSEGRDKRMHKNILESERYPEIAFYPDRVQGTLAKANVHGRFRIHGQDHEMAMVVETTAAGDRLHVSTRFEVPYVAWGMKNPSTLFLRVGDKVSIEVRAVGHAKAAAETGARLVSPSARPRTIARGVG